MSSPFVKLHRHSDHKVETEMANIYNVIQLLRTSPQFINARAYAEAIAPEIHTGELVVLNDLLSSTLHKARIQLKASTTSFPALSIRDDNTASVAGLFSVIGTTTGADEGVAHFTQQSTGQPGVVMAVGVASYTDNLLELQAGGGMTGNLLEGAGGTLDSAGQFTSASAASLKDFCGLEDVDVVLDSIRHLDLHRFSYKSDTKRRVFMGATAEDWNDIFDNRSPGGIGGRDAAMVSLAGVQSLAKKVEALEERIRQLEASHAP